MIISKTPLRISFFGGGTDYPEWLKNNNGLVVSTSINKYIYICFNIKPSLFHKKYIISYRKIEKRKKISDINHPSVRACLDHFNIQPGCEIIYNGDLPARSGLGSSSSFTIGLLNCIYNFKGIEVTKKKLAQKAIFIEKNILKENVGLQDQIACAYGGLNIIRFRNKSFKVKKIDLKKNTLKTLNDNLLLCYSGIQRISNDIAKKYVSKFSIKFYENLMKTNYDLAKEGINLIKKKDFDQFGKLLDKSWKIKKNLHKSVTSSKLDEFYNNAINTGALGGKMLGAGGGGFFLFYVPKKNQAKFFEKNKNFYISDFKFESDGSKIINYSI